MIVTVPHSIRWPHIFFASRHDKSVNPVSLLFTRTAFKPIYYSPANTRSESVGRRNERERENACNSIVSDSLSVHIGLLCWMFSVHIKSVPKNNWPRCVHMNVRTEWAPASAPLDSFHSHVHVVAQDPPENKNFVSFFRLLCEPAKKSRFPTTKTIFAKIIIFYWMSMSMMKSHAVGNSFCFFLLLLSLLCLLFASNRFDSTEYNNNNAPLRLYGRSGQCDPGQMAHAYDEFSNHISNSSFFSFSFLR